MKCFITLAALAICICASAAEHSKAIMTATYRFEGAKRAIDSIRYDRDEMVLQIAPDESRYFSAKTEFYDSLAAAPGGREMISKMLSDALDRSGAISRDASGKITAITIRKDDIKDVPRRGEKINVYKRPQEGRMTVITGVGSGEPVYYEYEVATDDWNWEPGDSVREILGYECQNATADYHGRRWTVWFAAEVTVSDGPWLFCGLPGLVMAAESEGGEYRYTITGLHNSSEDIKDMPGNPVTEKTSRKEALRAIDDNDRNPGLQYGITEKMILHHDLQETDYR